MLLRHSAVVRITHGIHTLSLFALLISGVAILMAHPRLYWGETGAFGSPALIELPLPLNTDQSGWGRSLHFLTAWIAVVNGTIYASFGLMTNHFRGEKYNALQRLAYLAVTFLLFPIMIGTGLAMSPAVGAVLPMIVGIFGGHQSARTIHFVVMDFLVLFTAAHVVMAGLAGRNRILSMVTGYE